MFALASMIAGAEANFVMLNWGKYSGVNNKSDSPRFETKEREKPRRSGLGWTRNVQQS